MDNISDIGTVIFDEVCSFITRHYRCYIHQDEYRLVGGEDLNRDGILGKGFYVRMVKIGHQPQPLVAT